MRAFATLMDRPRLHARLMAVLVGLATLILYWPATGFDFLNYDDPTFVTANAHVQGGLNWQGVKWAFGLNGGDYWHPLTWLSLMLDASLFGQNAGGFHFTNVAFHAVNGLLLFLLLRMLTGAMWRSAVVAALFALHPLRVESVAWVAERKDVLSGCFGLLALIAYARYAENAVVSNQWSVISNQSPRGNGPQTRESRLLITDHRSLLYFLSLGFLACGLMSKAMLVTWPFVMLLLDYWPLGRMQNAAPPDTATLRSAATEVGLPALRSTLFCLVREKIPFFVLSGIACVLTYLTEGGRPEVAGFEASPALLRLQNAFVAYACYLGKTFWPVNLAVPYTNPGHWSWLEFGGAVLVVVGVWLAVLWLGRRRPCLLVGWCWFWGTLIPVIGLTKGWGSFMADRFTYLPSIGLLMLTVWGVGELTRGWRCRALVLSVAGGAVIVCCVVLTQHQLRHWRNSIALFEHVVAVAPDNPTAHCNLGAALDFQGDAAAAAVHYRVAIASNPRDQEAHFNLGRHLKAQGHWSEAAREFLAVTRLRADAYLPRLALVECLIRSGQTREATQQTEEALRLLAAMPAAPWNQPVLQTTAAMLNNLAWSLATASLPENRDAAHAVQFAERACELTRNQSAALLGTLAAAYAEAGRFKEAVRAGEQASTVATLSGDQLLLRKTQERLEKYRAGQPYHEPAAPTAESPPGP